MRMIDKDALLSDIERTIGESGCVNHEGEIMDCVRYAPTVDAAQVCRCRDCTHYRAQRIYNGEPTLYVCCRTNGYSCGENHFCAWGEQSTVPMHYRYTAGCISYYDGEKERSPVETISAVPVVRGEWEVAIGYDPNKKVQCQNCYKMAYEPTPYCPNCGAKMEDKPVETLQAQLAASQNRAQDARNELCLKCGRYSEAHNGACDGCRWKEI